MRKLFSLVLGLLLFFSPLAVEADEITEVNTDVENENIEEPKKKKRFFFF